MERAKQEYGRIVTGAEKLERDGHKLYLLTITTKGGGLSVQEAEKNYLLWTNRLLSTLRADSKRRGEYWAYVAVTERQKRAHPHSHLITTYSPDDLRTITTKHWQMDNSGKRVYENRQKTVSDYMWKCVQSAGLGQVYDIAPLRNTAAAARYVAKYLFKDSMMTDFPKGWKRVRYSSNFPNLVKGQGHGTDAFPLLSYKDWKRLYYADVVYTDEETSEVCAFALPAFVKTIVQHSL